MIPEQVATLAAPGVRLEARVAVPARTVGGVVICHPHPLYGGDMDNHIVVVVAVACQAAGLATLRFNFRGVGGSSGIHDEGRGEQADAVAALDHLATRLPPGAPLALAGYSFGAVVATAVTANGRELAGLALVAPPLAFPGREELRPSAPRRGPLLVVAGGADAYCPADALDRLARRVPGAAVRIIEGADHFFAGTLESLSDALSGWARQVATCR
ncbi:MAG TPA: alpha/beta fold hydrolase [Methylomirabilota bacterium]|jgi:hypothetical protein|nr:alpha/beta fold hydrolase [Methylomirabilota bacterium]